MCSPHRVMTRLSLSSFSPFSNHHASSLVNARWGEVFFFFSCTLTYTEWKKMVCLSTVFLPTGHHSAWPHMLEQQICCMWSYSTSWPAKIYWLTNKFLADLSNMHSHVDPWVLMTQNEAESRISLLLVGSRPRTFASPLCYLNSGESFFHSKCPWAERVSLLDEFFCWS